MIVYFWYMCIYIRTHVYKYRETFFSFVMRINMFYWKIFMIVIISVLLLTHKILFLNPWILLYCMCNQLITPSRLLIVNVFYFSLYFLRYGSKYLPKGKTYYVAFNSLESVQVVLIQLCLLLIVWARKIVDALYKPWLQEYYLIFWKVILPQLYMYFLLLLQYS